MIQDHGADRIGEPTQAHMVAIDARAPLYDGGICTRIDCVSLGVVVNRGEAFMTRARFWPKRYAIWGRLVAQQPGQIGYSIIEPEPWPLMPGRVPRASRPTRCQELAQSWAPVDTFTHTVTMPTTPPASVGQFNHTALDDCHDRRRRPRKRTGPPIDARPFYGYALKPGDHLHLPGLKVTDDTAAVHFATSPAPTCLWCRK